MDEIDQKWMGPCMLALSKKRQRFVLAMASNPFGSRTDWAIEAGFSDKSEGAKVRAHECWHDPKVQAAIQEVAKSTLGTMGPLIAVHAVLELAKNSNHPQHSKAVEMILNRTGFAEKQQIEVVHRDLTGDALIERVRLLEQKYGLAKPEPKLIEGEVVSRETSE